MRVIFHGHLRDLCPIVYDMTVDSPYEALTALVTQIPALQVLRDGEGFPCRVVGFHTAQSLLRHCPDLEEIHVMPDYTVGGKAWLQIGIGALLIAAAFIPGLGAIGGVQVGSLLFSMGASLVLGGLLQLIAPTPSKDSNPDASKYLGGPKNTVALGTRIPIAYGVCRLYGQFLSYDVNVIGVPVTGE